MRQSILVIDDEPPILTLMERILVEKTSYHVMTTHNALQAPDLLKTRTFDVLVTDIRMPGMSGLDILRLIRSRNRSEEVILITAFPSLETALEAYSLHAYDYIVKPFTRERLIAAVNGAMRVRETKRQAERLESMLGGESFAEAMARFKSEYVRQMAVRIGRDAQEIAKRTGLPVEEIAEALGEDE
jgi:DNA-binding NtrC family response regulator